MSPRMPMDGPGRLGLLAVALLAVAAALVAWPIRPDVPPRAPAVDDPAEWTTSPEAAPDDVAAWQRAVVASNLFSGSRRAPTERFRLPGLDAAPALMPSSADSAAQPVPAPDDSTALMLLGLVQVDGERQALLAVAAHDSVARLVGVGGRIGVFRVRSIGTDHVDVVSPAGPRTLRLARTSPSDSSEMFP